MRRPEFAPISTATDPVEAALALSQDAIARGARGTEAGWAHKCLVEWAYESTRLALAPDRPSRLTSLFCFMTLEEANRFAVRWGKAAVFSGHLANESSQGYCRDFARYYQRKGDIALSPASYRSSWTSACRHAQAYWSTSEDELTVREVLVEGEVLLDPEPVWVWSEDK